MQSKKSMIKRKRKTTGLPSRTKGYIYHIFQFLTGNKSEIENYGLKEKDLMTFHDCFTVCWLEVLEQNVIGLSPSN